jgi:hypothetical protein
METIALRKKLHNLIGASSQDKLEEIYNSFNDDLYSDEFKAMTGRRFFHGIWLYLKLMILLHHYFLKWVAFKQSFFEDEFFINEFL